MGQHTAGASGSDAHGREIYVDAVTGSKTAGGTDGDDIFHVRTDGHPSNQVHLYGGAGDDIFNLDLDIGGSDHIQHGHHIFAGDGADQINFNDAHLTRGTLVGRLDDYDPRSDVIRINGHEFDPWDSASDQIPGLDARIVAYQGQQWLEIRNDQDGRILYALEAARLLEVPVDGEDEEPHFLKWSHQVPDELPTVPFDPSLDNVPDDLLADFVAENVIEALDGDAAHVLNGTDADDLIIGKRGNDTIHGGAGNDLIRGGFGDDLICGGEGDDILEGGKGRDTLHGGPGNDSLFGGADDDVLYGGEGNDYLHGGSGNDELHSGPGNNTLIGGTGNDTLYGEGEFNHMDGGSGDDVFYALGELSHAIGGTGRDAFIVAPHATLHILDFDPETDRLGLREHFTDVHALQAATSTRVGPDDPDRFDLVIDLPDGGELVLRGQGALADDIGNFVMDRDPEHGDDKEDAFFDPPPFALPVQPPLDDEEEEELDDEIEDDDEDEEVDFIPNTSSDGGGGAAALILVLGAALLAVGGGFGG